MPFNLRGDNYPISANLVNGSAVSPDRQKLRADSFFIDDRMALRMSNKVSVSSQVDPPTDTVNCKRDDPQTETGQENDDKTYGGCFHID